MNKNLTILAGVLALIGLIINVSVDRDNIYDMTMAGLWTLTLVVAFLGAFIGGKKATTATTPTTNSA
jgi:uncharacterized integral membrane protein